MVVGKIKKYVPIVCGHRVFALADVVPKPARDKLTHRRHLRRSQPFYPEQFINRSGGLKDFELAGWIRPLIFLCTGEEHGPWRAEGRQTMLVERQPLRRVVEFLELRIEPMRKTVVDGLYRFSRFTAAGRAAAAAGLVGKNHR